METHDSARRSAAAATGRYSAALEALDAGKFAGAIALYETGASPEEGDAGALWRAEVASYLGRIDEAQDAVARAADVGDARLALRRDVLEVELRYARNDVADAEDRLRALRARARELGDAFLEMRAWYDLARVARKRNDWLQCVEVAAVASALASELGNPYYRGCAQFNYALALYEEGHVDAAEAAYAESIELLKRSENLRYRAIAEAAYAGLLVARGDADVALALLESASETALRVGNVRDAQAAGHATAWANFALGRFADARRHVQSLVEMDRADENSAAELFGLKLLASAAFAEGDSDQARRASDEFERLAAVSGDEGDKLQAELISARARLSAGDLDAAADLERIAAGSEPSARAFETALASVFLAQALHEIDPLRASRVTAEAEARAAASPNAWVRAELQVFAARRAASPIRVEPEGVLVFDLRDTLPTRTAAQAILDKALLRSALERTNGHYAAAGRLIGEKRWNTRHLALQHRIDVPTRRLRRGTSGGRKAAKA